MKHVSAAMVVIRQQRQRASLERICRSLRLHQLLANVNEKEVETELEAAVQRGELYAVDKRGYRSYQVTVCFVTIFCLFSHHYLEKTDACHLISIYVELFTDSLQAAPSGK